MNLLVNLYQFIFMKFHMEQKKSADEAFIFYGVFVLFYLDFLT